ncbi:hypothetical protein PLICRDRAFT_54964 [Plicaturopsis crispa FD-325 SS-3]|nr:hypothetical protein PLICRDRAFT_54964 [Plicaturopsis crispa FD-325 SS-3]
MQMTSSDMQQASDRGASIDVNVNLHLRRRIVSTPRPNTEFSSTWSLELLWAAHDVLIGHRDRFSPAVILHRDIRVSAQNILRSMIAAVQEKTRHPGRSRLRCRAQPSHKLPQTRPQDGTASLPISD